MDAATLTNMVMTALTPLLPYLATAGTAIATDIGDATFQQGKHLFETIKGRFAKEKDGGSATQALQTFVNGDADYQAVVQTKLERILRDDPAFASSLSHLLQSGPLQSLIVGEEAKARNIGMANNLGAGRQEIQTGRASDIQDIRMNINADDIP